MWKPEEYTLVDFGNGRKLEAFAGHLVNRPCPAAELALPRMPEAWSGAPYAFDLSRTGLWEFASDRPNPWELRYGKMVFCLQPTPFGHIGIFPEQAENWDWLASILVGQRSETPPVPGLFGVSDANQRVTFEQRSTFDQRTTLDRRTTLKRPRAINLFGYTGGTTLQLASAGCEVTHVDASKPSVAWSRMNAKASGLDAAPVRWIVEDANKYVQRELRRGQKYEIIVLDPPSFGHGPAGERWDLTKDLPQLLADCLRLFSETPLALLLTGHSEDIDVEAALHVAALEAKFAHRGTLDYDRSIIHDTSDRELDFGYRLRWST